MPIPILYLKGISTGDFEEVLAALVGKDAPGLSASTIARLKDVWTEEHERWQKRDLSTKRYVYFWVDGIHLEARLEDQAQCILVMIGATPEGKKELVGFTDGMRESALSWRDLLLDLKRRGVAAAPELAVADGALGFWEGAGRGVADDTRTALLGAQDGERFEQAAEEPAFAHCKTSGWPRQRRMPSLPWMPSQKATAKIRQSRRLPDERSRYATLVLRLPRRTLEALANDKPNRKHVCDRAASHDPFERLPLEQDCTYDGVQACRRRSEKLASARRSQPVAKVIEGVKFTDGIEAVRQDVRTAAA